MKRYLFALLLFIACIIFAAKNYPELIKNYIKPSLLTPAEITATSTPESPTGSDIMQSQSPSATLTTAPENNLADTTKPIFSKSFSINKSTMVTHPFTGARVNVDTYAKSKGYDLSKYYNKTISCMIYESYDKNSNKSMFLSVTCGGNELYHQNIESEAEKQNLIATIKSYLP